MLFRSCGAVVCTAWIWRLESIYSPDHRIYGKRERGIYTDGSSWRKNSIADDFVHTVYCLCISDLYPALYALCGSSSNCTKRNGNRKDGSRHCTSPVCDCVDRCIHRAWNRNVVWIIKKVYIWLFTNCRKHSAEDVKAIFFLWAIPIDNFSSPLTGTAVREGWRKN